MADDDLEIILEGDDGAGGAGGEGGEGKAAGGAVERPSVDQGVEGLRKALDEEKAGREAERAARQLAENQAAEERRKAEGFARKAQDGDFNTILNGIQVAEEETKNLKRDLIEAQQNGDFSRAADLTEKMGDVRYRLGLMKDAKANIEARKPRAGAEGRVEPQQQDPFEGYLAKFTPRSQTWLRSNSDYVKDPAKNKRLLAAHYQAEADGLVADTDAYFERIETALGMREAPAKGSGKGPALAGAPVSRQAPSASGGASDAGNVVRLTVLEQETARAMGMTNAEYAKEKRALQREGKL